MHLARRPVESLASKIHGRSPARRFRPRRTRGTHDSAHHRPVIAAGVVLSTAATDAVYVFFTASVAARRRLAAAAWSSFWYLPTVRLRRHQLHLELGVRTVRRARLLHRRLPVHHPPRPRPGAARVTPPAAQTAGRISSARSIPLPPGSVAPRRSGPGRRSPGRRSIPRARSGSEAPAARKDRCEGARGRAGRRPGRGCAV
jgi:hypothetical protein